MKLYKKILNMILLNYKKRLKKVLCLLLWPTFIQAATKYHMQQYLKNFDLKWNHAPKFWDEAALNGNGRLGVMVRQDVNGFDIGDTMLYEDKSQIPTGRFVATAQSITGK